MYVCICHGLNEKAVHEARSKGATKAGQVYRHHGVRPQCGKCVNAMRDVLKGDGVTISNATPCQKSCRA